MPQKQQPRWCSACGGTVRPGTGGYYHVVPGYPEYETIARHTTTTEPNISRRTRTALIHVPPEWNN